MKNHRTILSLLLLMPVVLSGHTPATAYAGKRAAVKNLTGRISIDGTLNEPDWAQAMELGEILQREPNQEVPATERTVVKLLLDKDNLYVGVICYDSEPDKIVGTQMRRDAPLESDDRIQILLDTFHDRRNAFYFATNPAGALVDGLIIENGRNINYDWNAIWNVRVRHFQSADGAGWSAEFSIPFKSLGFNPGQDVWGFNFSRRIIRKIEEDRWSSPRLDVQFTQVSEAGDIEGLKDAEQGLGLDMRPYAVGKWQRDEQGNNKFTGTGGADVFYNITSGLRLTATVNTDFAETEVDDRQINLTRFPLFFPEKRSFFLENAGVFNFAQNSSSRPDLVPFFSRRIGLLNGQEVPILAGAKLTGKIGKYDIGALAVRTRETGFVEAKNFFVGRVKRNLFKQSYIGGLYTEGDPSGTTTSRTFGADLRLATANLLNSRHNFSLDIFASKTDRKNVRGDDLAYGFSASYPNDRWEAYADWKHFGPDYSPALGFLSRRAVDNLFLGMVFQPRPKKFLNVRQMFNEVFFTWYRRNDLKQVENWRFFTAPVNWRFNSGDRFEVNWVPQFERLFLPFEIADGVILPPGDYQFTRYRVEFNTAAKRRWEIGATWWFGGYYSGHADEISTEFVYKIAPRFRFAIESSQTFASLKEGSFVARIFASRIDLAFSPFLTLSNLIQFDNETRNVGWQSRLRWILRPGNDFFLVFNQGWEQNYRGGFNFRQAGTRLTGKMQYTFRF
ncbi:MAG: carbohydrate binding family 9 domain-containing protein [Acidobacteria bacterium]|nr:carbohydrate binding family 9 domain-containing protein [Acidobacteriota bacterium]